MLQKWLREKHEIDIIISKYVYSSKRFFPLVGINGVGKSFKKEYDTYEEALEAGLKEALNLI